MLVFAGAALAGAGDIFLSYLADKLRMTVAYKNHSGFISCFILRSIKLDNPVFALKDLDFALGCQKALIRPDFSELIKRKAIILECDLENASFLGAEEKIKESDDNFLAFLQGDVTAVFDMVANLVFDSVRTKLIVYGDTVEFPYYEAHSEGIKLKASGSASKSGDFDIEAKAFFSRETAEGFPEELKALLTEGSDGWFSYYLRAAGGKDKPFLELESDMFRLQFERVEAR